MDLKVTNIEKSAVDKKISRVLVLQLVMFGSKILLVQGVPAIFQMRDLLDMLLLGIVAIMMFSIGKHILKRLRPEHIFMTIATSIMFLISMLINQDYLGGLLEMVPRFVFPCYASYILASVVFDINHVLYYHERYMKFLIMTSIVTAIFFSTHISVIHRNLYSMPYSDITLIPTVWYFIRYFEEKDKTSLILSIIGLLLILVFGSRNPLLSILALFIYFGLKYVFTSITMKKAVVTLCLVVIVAFFAINFEAIVIEFLDLLGNMGIHSRTLNKLLYVGIDDSGRSTIFRLLIAQLNDKPLLGLGIGGPEAALNILPHNLYLGILVYFGYPIGLLVLLLLCRIWLKAWTVSSNISKRLLLMYMVIIIPRGIVGISILSTEYFWLLLGICSSVIYQHKKKTFENKLQEMHALSEN